jgi:hypothetical protein
MQNERREDEDEDEDKAPPRADPPPPATVWFGKCIPRSSGFLPFWLILPGTSAMYRPHTEEGGISIRSPPIVLVYVAHTHSYWNRRVALPYFITELYFA